METVLAGIPRMEREHGKRGKSFKTVAKKDVLFFFNLFWVLFGF
jgi:hypothetical protein